ncbi:MAG TPA: potassium channel family protein [Actinophytocola sp.]|uniref:potassium channel family protein n=1 Tax=Actinophytocola sp. TaxID=1872138 RepID=UPI002DBE221F|nr:potassium channel family protein [Actinophytocola sp.]HEU5472643.1 potassium channel family protein [Actinophytocola sp.]
MNRIQRPRLVRRRVDRFLDEPATIRNAMAVLSAVMTVTVVLGGLAVWIFAPKDFPNFGLGMWWTLQTVTTVGYGDVTPTTWVGRTVGAVIMLESVAFLSILTALIASSFVNRFPRRHATDPVLKRLDEIAERLSAIEAALRAEADPDR